MSDTSQFIVEFLNTNGGDFESIKNYCASHNCGEKTQFHDKYNLCRSYRNGECMMVKFLEGVRNNEAL